MPIIKKIDLEEEKTIGGKLLEKLNNELNSRRKSVAEFGI